MIVFPTPFFARNAIYRGPVNFVGARCGYLEPVAGTSGAVSRFFNLGSPDGLRWYQRPIKGELKDYMRTDQLGAFVFESRYATMIQAFGKVYMLGRLDSLNSTISPALFRLDGDQWNRVATPADLPFGGGGVRAFAGAAMLGATLVLVCDDGTIISTTNGTAFTKHTNIPLTGITGFAAGTGVLVVTGGYNSIYSAASAAGPWTSRTYGSPNLIRAIGAGNLFIIGGNGNNFATSPINSGATWTQRTFPSSPSGSDYIFGLGYNGNRWLMLGDTGGYPLQTSLDGISFTPVANLPFNSVQRVLWVGDKWIGLDWSYRGLVSPDGLTWSVGPRLPGYGTSTVIAAVPN